MRNSRLNGGCEPLATVLYAQPEQECAVKPDARQPAALAALCHHDTVAPVSCRFQFVPSEMHEIGFVAAFET
jgi:hypothetical protein